MTSTSFPYKSQGYLEHLALVQDHYLDPTVKRDVKKINELFFKDGVNNCVALAVYSSLRFSGIASETNGDQVVDAFRNFGEKRRAGFSDLDIHLLIEKLTNGEYTASLIEHSDYQSNRLRIESRTSPAMIAEVTLNGTKECHVYPILRSENRKYHIIDDKIRERILGDAIGTFIGSNKSKEVICIHKKDVFLQDICQVF